MKLLDAKRTKPLEGGASFSIGHRLYRAVWAIAWFTLASWTPPPLHRWRAFVLRLFGARIHPTARVYASARIWYPANLSMAANSCLGPRVNCYCMASIDIGTRSIISQDVSLCAGTHDVRDRNFQLVLRPISIGENVWVAAEAFVGPGAVIADGVVIGARAVLFGKTEPYKIYSGNPAIFLKKREFRDNEESK